VSADNPYRYVGQLGYYTHWMDPSLTDLLHLGMRFYEPGVGRFSQVDPAREGVNWYVYVWNSPLAHLDPSGTIPCVGKGDFTNLMCLEACRRILPSQKGKKFDACWYICTSLKGKTCNALFSYCEHIARHPSTSTPYKKTAVEVCLLLYNELCSGQ